MTSRAVSDLVVEHRSYEGAGSAVGRVGGIALDVVGVVLWLALTVWVAGVARTPAEAAPTRDLLLLAGAAYALTRVATVLQPWLVPAALLVTGTATAVWSIGGALSGGGVLFGYANAAAAFHVASVAAGLMVVVRLRHANPWVGAASRWGGGRLASAGTVGMRSAELRMAAAVAATAACALVPLVTTAVTSTLLVLALPVTVVARELGWRVRGVVVGAALVALTAVGSTVAIGATYDGRGVVDWAVATAISGNRGQLWSEALDLTVANPVDGVGTGRFSHASATASSDTDVRWAHNAFLQLAAETGLPGAALGLLLLSWAFARMWAGHRDVATGVAAAGLAAMVVTASIDYAWHYPGVMLTTVMLAGSGPARAHRPRAVGPAGAGRLGAGGNPGPQWPPTADAADRAGGNRAGAPPGDRAAPASQTWPRRLDGGGRDGA